MMTEEKIIEAKTMNLYSATEIDIFKLREEDIIPEDIAHSPSLINRFGGHTLFPYSVGQHSVMASHFGNTREEQFAILMHDAPEYILQDLIRPIKHRPEFEFYRNIEDDVQAKISNKFGLEFPLP